MASGVAMAAQTRKSRFSKSRLPNCKNRIVRLSFDFCQRRRKQGATQVRIMAPEVPSVVREPTVNFLQFGSNNTESHRDVCTDLQYISEIWDQNAARPEQFQVTAYPGCYSEQNIGVAFRPEGIPPVPGQSFGWIGFVVNDLSANQKLLGTTGVQGTMLVTGADLAQVRVRLAGYPFVRISADLSAPRISVGYPFFYVLIFIPYYT